AIATMATSQKVSMESTGIAARSWRIPKIQSSNAPAASQPAPTHNDARVMRRGLTGSRSSAKPSISSSIDASFMSFAFHEPREPLEPAMDIHLDQRFALAADPRRFRDRGALDLHQRNRLRLPGRQTCKEPVKAEPCVHGLVLSPDRGVAFAEFDLVPLAAEHVDPAIARNRCEPRQKRAAAVPGRALAVQRHQSFLYKIVNLVGRAAACEVAPEPGAAIAEQRAIGCAVAALRCGHKPRERGFVNAHRLGIM